ncbi:MAG: tetratricopeptide repeat protein, partial [Candidatus Zixiibacteriota bacterium]
YDSAVVFYHAMLEIEPNNSDAITGIGRFFNQQARWASDSASAYKEAGDEAQDKAWRDKRQELFDSSGVYFKQAFDLLLEDEFVASEYGRITYLSGDFEQSAIAFKRLTDIRPQENDYWVTLGDCYLQLQRFPEAIAAYEGALQTEPNARDILENLKDLYHNEHNSEKEAEMVERLKKL